MSRTLLFSLFVLLLIGCAETPSQPEQPEPVSFAETSYAEGFSIVDFHGMSCLETYTLEGEETSLSCRVCKGIPPDTLLEVNHYLFRDSVTITTLSTTHLAYFWKLQQLDQVLGTAYASWVKNQEVNARLEDGRMRDISGEKNIDFEQMVDLSPDVLITYPYGGEGYEHFEELGIVVVPFSEYLEIHPLGRAEWIKAAGWLIDQEEQANAAFAEIEARYNEAKELAANVQNRPSVFTGSNDGGVWFAPSGQSFIAQFIHDAGGSYLFSDHQERTNLKLDFEVLLERAMLADYWGKVSYREEGITLESIREDDPRYASLPVFEKGQVFYCNAAKTDYFGDAIVEPEAILQDLIAILHPELKPQHTARYFQPVELE
ncbi:MAG: ABC transporter substrate-binding protein [Flavobacteriales bacterium]|nr:ABC transporter substrate-binding protein [Flavobacteriales bacterium]